MSSGPLALRHPSLLLRSTALLIDAVLFLILFLPVEFLLVDSIEPPTPD